MYKCVCGYKSIMKSSMLSHLSSCSRAKSNHSNSDIVDDIVSTGLALSLFDSCCDIISDSSSDFSGFGGGDFGGGGASGSWDD